jgi:hypothetical protein
MTERDSTRRPSADDQPREFLTIPADEAGPDGATQAATFTHTLTDEQRRLVINAELRLIAAEVEADR